MAAAILEAQGGRIVNEVRPDETESAQRPIVHLAWRQLLEQGAALLRDGSPTQLAPYLPILLDSDLRDEALSRAATLGSDANRFAGVAYARAALAASEAPQVVLWLLRARALADPDDQRFHARVARDLGARYLASAERLAAEALLRTTRGLLGAHGDHSPDLLQLEALLADFVGERQRSTRLNERSLGCAHEALTPMTQAIGLVNLAVAREASDPRSSASLARLALDVIASERLHSRAEAAARNVLGYVLLPLGDLVAARQELSLGRSLADSSSYGRVAAFTRFNLSIHAELDGREGDAEHLLSNLEPFARRYQFNDLVGWIQIRRGWLAIRNLGSPAEAGRMIGELGAEPLTSAQQDALRVLKRLARVTSDSSFGEIIEAASARNDQLDAFALRLNAAARDYDAGRTRRARQLTREAVAVGRELGLRATPNWWSSEPVRIAQLFEPDFARRLVGANAPTLQQPAAANAEIETLPPEIWREGRTGSRVLRRLFRSLSDAQDAGVRRDDLCDALWPDTDGDKAVKNLYAAIDDLRRVLRHGSGIAVVNERGRYRVITTR